MPPESCTSYSRRLSTRCGGDEEGLPCLAVHPHDRQVRPRRTRPGDGVTPCVAPVCCNLVQRGRKRRIDAALASLHPGPARRFQAGSRFARCANASRSLVLHPSCAARRKDGRSRSFPPLLVSNTCRFGVQSRPGFIWTSRVRGTLQDRRCGEAHRHYAGVLARLGAALRAGTGAARRQDALLQRRAGGSVRRHQGAAGSWASDRPGRRPRRCRTRTAAAAAPRTGAGATGGAGRHRRQPAHPCLPSSHGYDRRRDRRVGHAGRDACGPRRLAGARRRRRPLAVVGLPTD